MFINKDEIRRLFKEGKLNTPEDLQSTLSSIIKDVVETIYEGELTELLGYSHYDKSSKETNNSRNGYSNKKVKSNYGEIELSVPRDRNGEYEPKIVKKRQTDITGIEEHIISMYAKGMTTRDIQSHMESLYGLEFSAEAISKITDKVLERAKEWQNRPLDPIYSIIFLDALFYKMRVDGVIKNVAAYAVIGINLEGNKECLGILIMENESAKFWLSVLNELKNRGVEDVLIFSIDGLPGLNEAIKAVYPESEIQRCIVHQVRNSLKFVSYKDRKELAKDLKKIYTSSTEESGKIELDKLNEKWGKKYPNIIKSWQNNWIELSTLFKYSPEIRTLIYTTNPIESFNSKLKKVSKNRGVFPTEESLFKLLYLAINDISKKWDGRIRDWSKIYPQLYIYFQERIDRFTNG
jgi:transposase-like protein